MMPKQMTRDERAAYQRDYRAKQKLRQQQSEDLAEPGKTPKTPVPDMSTVSTPSRRKPSFLVAPDDDCGACHHDRHTYHMGLTGRCTAATGYHERCDCPAYVEPLDLLNPF
jgi:hypothetical protein